MDPGRAAPVKEILTGEDPGSLDDERCAHPSRDRDRADVNVTWSGRPIDVNFTIDALHEIELTPDATSLQLALPPVPTESDLPSAPIGRLSSAVSTASAMLSASRPTSRRS